MLREAVVEEQEVMTRATNAPTIIRRTLAGGEVWNMEPA
jgi:hypothetical protein